MSMPNLSYKNLIRIPVWALYSLILGTVVMSFVMLVNIWFPETIDEELIWKIVLSYAVFLISALVIANLTDKVKNMKQYEGEK
jgi:FtsH-binding integral membrane protein